MFESRSALDAYRAETEMDGADGRRGLRLGEIGGSHLVQLGIYPGGASRVAKAVQPILGEQLPESSVLALMRRAQLIMRIAPDQYWVMGAETALDTQLRSAIPADAGCVTSLDAARTRLLIEGQAARALLTRLVAIDLHPAVFPVGSFAQTGIHHVGGLLLKVGENRYEFFALRSFAASIWEVLLDAARPFGYEISLPKSMK